MKVLVFLLTYMAAATMQGRAATKASTNLN